RGEHLVEDRCEDVDLRREIMHHGGLAPPDGIGDLLHARCRVTLGRKQPLRRQNDALARALALPASRLHGSDHCLKPIALQKQCGTRFSPRTGAAMRFPKIALLPLIAVAFAGCAPAEATVSSSSAVVSSSPQVLHATSWTIDPLLFEPETVTQVIVT